MNRPYVVFVPDELWDKFRSGEVDHFEYGQGESVAVYADGNREAFNSTVTDDEVAREREEHIRRLRESGALVLGPFRTTITVDRKNFRGVITGVVK